MKKQKYLILFAVALFAIMLFASSIDVNAATTNYSNTDLYVRTKIERWNYHYKDLVFTKNDDWGGSGSNDWYTKTVWLTNSATGDPSSASEKMEITTYMLDENNKVSLDGFTYFDPAETIYLVEKYHINTSSSNLTYTTGEWNSDNSLPCRDRLDFSFDYSSGIAKTIKETSMNNYNPNNSYTLYVKALYDEEDVVDRDLNVYFNLEESTTKAIEKSQGTINLPVYAIKVDLTARGNAMEVGKFAVGRSFTTGEEVYCDDSNLGVSSSVGRASGYILDSYDHEQNEKINFQGISNRTINDFYIFYNTEGLTQSNNNWTGWVDYLDRSDFSLSVLAADSTLPNTYIRTISGTYENHQTPPNGVFFDVLPFAIAILIATTGIVILKKNSIK